MSDYIIRGMAADKQVRFFAANTKELVEKARQIHNTSPIATAALGRLMTGTAMMGSMCKNDSIKFLTLGPAKYKNHFKSKTCKTIYDVSTIFVPLSILLF